MSGCGGYKHCRASSFSDDGGITWSSPIAEPSLPDPVCKGGIASGAAAGELWFANDATTTDRTHVTLRHSRDGGASWDAPGLLLWPGAAGYVDLIMHGRKAVAVAFENATCSISVAVVPVGQGAAAVEEK